jgi:phosphatidylserine decarboxylase
MAHFLLRMLYSSRLVAPLRWLATRGILNRIARWWFTSRISRWHIRSFIRRHAIDVAEFASPVSEYKNFNEFFIRHLKKEVRPVDKSAHSISSPADGNALFIPRLEEETTFHVKKHRFCLTTFIGSKEHAAPYIGGSMLLVRLAPEDYHRFHMPVAGSIADLGSLGGRYETAQPLGYRSQLPLLTNQRRVFEICTATNQRLLLVTVGALCVGSVETTYNPQTNYLLKGSELGYFAFGGSTAALLAPPDSINIRTDILTASAQHAEVPVRMGEAISQWRLHTTSLRTTSPERFV